MIFIELLQLNDKSYLMWGAELDSGMNNNWSGSHVDFEEYIKEYYGEQALIDMDLR